MAHKEDRTTTTIIDIPQEMLQTPLKSLVRCVSWAAGMFRNTTLALTNHL